MNINKNFIIIFGTLTLLLIAILGTTTYYKEKKMQVKAYTPISIPEEKEYSIWCHDGDIRYNCSDREFFKQGESVAISINLTQFNNIPYNPYYLCYYSDLGALGKQCLLRSASMLGGLSLTEELVLGNKEVFTLLKVSVYPDNDFEKTEGITIMDLTGKLIK
jgi:hypothetical protein